MKQREINFVIVAENLRIGGVQRLLIDETYQFLEWNISPRIISLSPRLEEDNLPDLDKEYFPSKELNITYLNPSKIDQCKYLYKFLREENAPRYFITHSTTGAALVKMCAFMAFKKVVIILQIHQLISLSDKKQQLKRFLHSMCANQVLFSSKQFLLEWKLVLSKRKFLKLVYRKSLKFDRMGVYLPRLASSDFKKRQICRPGVPHLIFLSRVTSWKGFEKFKSITSQFASTEMHTLTMTASNYRRDIFDPKEFNSDTSHVVFNYSVTSLHLDFGSVHLYPSDYGPNVRYPQSIGMNVLEMISQGIPSLISKEGFESWPELREMELVKVVDWTDAEEVSRMIQKSKELPVDVRINEFERASEAISIVNHCRSLMDLMQEFSK